MAKGAEDVAKQPPSPTLTKSNNGQVMEFSAMYDQIQSEVRNTLDHVLGNATYDTADVPAWVDTITSGILERLQVMSENYKYIVSINILQRTNAGFHLFSVCYWDQTTDGAVTVRWENKTLNCIASVYGVAL